MKNVVIDIEDGISTIVAVDCVRQVVADEPRGIMRRCCGTSFLTEDGFIWVKARRNKRTEKYIVSKDVLQGVEISSDYQTTIFDN